MAINDYLGCEGTTILIEEEHEIFEAIDLIHTQVIDRFGNKHPALLILEQTMDALSNLNLEA